MNCSPPGSSVHGIYQVRILEWVAISFSRHRLKITKCTGFQNQIPWGFFSVPLLDPQVGKSGVGPRTFTTVWELLWYDCSPVCGLFAQWDNILISKDIILLTKICRVKSMVFLGVRYGCELDHKESCVCVRLPSLFSSVRVFVTPWTVAHQALLSRGFSRQEHWSRLSCSSPKKAEYQRIDAFELWCWRRLLRISGTARRSKRSNQLILKEINPEYSLEGLMLKLKLQYFCHLMGKLTH